MIARALLACLLALSALSAAEALKRITQGGDRPWFMYVPFHPVQTPVDVPAEYKQLCDCVKFHDYHVKHKSRLRLAAMVAQLDAKVGAFVTALERTGQHEKTWSIFTSDNGGIESLQNAYAGSVPHSSFNSENDPLRGPRRTLSTEVAHASAISHTGPASLSPPRSQRRSTSATGCRRSPALPASSPPRIPSGTALTAGRS
jgi:hypothetical protein